MSRPNRESGDGAPRVTIKEVARRAGVSIATVSRVANNVPHQVRAATRRRVLRAIRDLDFRPNALARSLHQNRTHTLGLVVPDVSNPYYAEVARGIEDVANQHGYSLFICNTDRKADSLDHHVTVLRDKRVDGIIIGGGGTLERRHFAALRNGRVKAVLIGRYGLNLPAIRTDNVKGGWEAATHLIRLGHRHIAVLAGPERSTTSADRLAGYRKAFEEHGLRLPGRWCVHGDLSPGSGLGVAAELMAAHPRPTAVLAVNDQMAIGAMRAILQRGLRVPQQVSVVGFDNIALASFVTPALTTMALPLHRMGAAAAETLLRVLAGAEKVEEVWFTPELVVRETSAGPSPD